jgi:hypothetical protein
VFCSWEAVTNQTSTEEQPVKGSLLEFNDGIVTEKSGDHYRVDKRQSTIEIEIR